MGQVIVGTTMSLDGFINDRTGSVAALYPNLEELREAIRRWGPVADPLQPVRSQREEATARVMVFCGRK